MSKTEVDQGERVGNKKPEHRQVPSAAPFYAIGLNFDDDLLCAVCAESEIKKSEYPQLLLMAISTTEIQSDEVCECGLSFGRPQAEEAVVRLIKLIEAQR